MKKKAVFAIVLLIIGGILVANPIKNKDKKKDKKPKYEKVFPQNKVNKVVITIKPADWKRMQADLESNVGKGGMPHGDFKGKDSLKFAEFRAKMDSLRRAKGDTANFEPMGENGMPPMGEGMGEGGFPPFGEGGDSLKFPQDSMHHPDFGGGMPPMGEKGLKMIESTPIYVPATFAFEGKEWLAVGMRFKGNSSLTRSYQEKNKKLPFLLDFDKFGDSIPALKNQNFYGFKKLSFSSNMNDNSLLHEKVAADVFREAGIKAPQTAFYAVYLNYGEGEIYLGLYTAVECIEDTMLKNSFGDDEGNCYKPDGSCASFAAKEFDTATFEKKNNKKKADFSDVKKLHSVIQSQLRKTNVKQWKKDLEAVFDVPVFLRWLAVNTVMQNWDTYGSMAHNYYLYNDPTTNKLTWIPWDNNEAMNSGGMGGGASLDMKKVTDKWPLIRYLLDQPEYETIYKQEIKNFVTKVFTPEVMNPKFDYFHTLVQPFASLEVKNTATFDKSLLNLKQHVEKRNQIAKKFVEK